MKIKCLCANELDSNSRDQCMICNVFLHNHTLSDLLIRIQEMKMNHLFDKHRQNLTKIVYPYIINSIDPNISVEFIQYNEEVYTINEWQKILHMKAFL